jgi:HK97 family phage portal protein
VKLFGFELSRIRAAATIEAAAVPVKHGGWFSIIRESFPGAWQQNVEISTPSVLAYPPVFACTTLIASDIGKCRIRLVEEDDAGVWTRTTSPAFSPLLRKPNRYQTFQKFAEQWIVSKLTFGNTYALKQRDRRGVVVAAYVLDPQQVTPLVAPDGSVYYQLGRSDLAGVPEADPITGRAVVVPAREIFHDLMVPLFHPLIGVTPIYACGLVALQGMKIGENSTQFFATGSNPGGVLTAPGAIDQTTADRLKAYWDENFTGANVGRVAVLGDGLKYEAMSVNATDSQLIEQLKWTVEQVCACYHVPAALIDSSHQPPYANSEPLVQQYYGQCLQSLFVAFENTLDEGLALPEVDTRTLGTEFDINDLIWLDVVTRTKAATDAIVGGVLSPNESRFTYFGVGAVEGGDTPYLQQQMVSIASLAERDSTDWLSPKKPAAPPALPPAEAEGDEDLDLNTLTGIVLKGVTRAA